MKVYPQAELEPMYRDKAHQDEVLQWWRDHGVDPVMVVRESVEVTDDGRVTYRTFQMEAGHRIVDPQTNTYRKGFVLSIRPEREYPL